MRSIRQLAEQLVHWLLEAFIPLRNIKEWEAFSFVGAHGIEEFTKHVAEEDFDEQHKMRAKLSWGNLQIRVPNDQGWYLIMPNGYAIEGMGNKGRTYIGKTETIMPRLLRVDNPHMSPREIRIWRRGL